MSAGFESLGAEVSGGTQPAQADTSDISHEARRLRLRAHRRARAHYLAAKRCQRRHMALGVPVVVFSTIVGSAIFASISERPELQWQIAVGLLSITSAVLASLQTFFRFAEAAAKHRESAAGYSLLYRELRMLLLQLSHSERAQFAERMAQLESILHRFDELESRALDVSDSLYDQAKREQSSDAEGV